MLVELAVRDLGVIADCSVTFGPGMTALTGETGAGKTLLINAVELLVGGRADSSMVRAGATEARVEGRFIDESGQERIVSRVVPVEGRSRAYIDGRMVAVSELSELGAQLVDLHGQHAHQSLLSAGTQRAALDLFASVDVEALKVARACVTEIDARIASLGGDSRERAREIDLLSYQLEEIEAANLGDLDEESSLDLIEETLADAVSHRENGTAAYDHIVRDGGAADLLGHVTQLLIDRTVFSPLRDRLVALCAEMDDIAMELRAINEGIEDDPLRLAEVRQRRQLLRDLCRRYGENITEVLEFAKTIRGRLDELSAHDHQLVELEAERTLAREQLLKEEESAGKLRREAAPKLSAVVQATLANLAMPRARFLIEVDGSAGEDVRYLLAANKGEDFSPLARAASGGELSRTMLALRLALLGIHASDSVSTETQRTLIFDEVDSGIGGEAAEVVGRALAAIAGNAQVLVVTHLAQVAASSHSHVSVIKEDVDGRTVARACRLELDDRIIELSRMLSGRPDSDTAQDHARELLELSAQGSDR